ncbi:hypothetical protein BJX64DRAFT_182843 [Aspergillus heterothallicus]
MALKRPMDFLRSNEAGCTKLDSSSRGSSSIQFFSVQEGKDVEFIRCIICHEQKQPAEMTELSCRHRHCVDCVRTWAGLYISGQITYPNFCCKQFEPAKSVILSLPEPQRQEFIDKAEECHLPSHRRWYCPEPSCARWIRPGDMVVTGTAFSRSFVCPYCKADICARCRGRGHPGDCPTDEGRKALLKLANTKGWKQCGRCGNLVDPVGEDGKPIGGCMHVVCPCRVEICYGGLFHHTGGCLMNNTWMHLRNSTLPRMRGVFRKG